jgi:CHAD domain-containing protein
LAKLLLHLQGARTATDIEDVHQVRVTCRRIRTALRLFEDCFKEAPVKKWQKRIKKLLKSFGDARDLDVQIAFLKEFLDHLDAEQKDSRPGLRRMMLRRQQRRDRVQSKVVRAVDNVQKKHILTEIHIHMEKVLFELTPLQPDRDSPAMRRCAHDRIQLRIQDLLNRQDALQIPEDIAGHHAVRIAAKKLRYAMEICNTALHGTLKPAIKKIKKLQTLLGEMHDCDVWNADIDHFIETEKQRTMDFYGHSRPFTRILPGLQYLQQDRRARREELYRKATEYLNRLNEDSFWVTVPEMVQQEANEPQETTNDAEDTPT